MEILNYTAAEARKDVESYKITVRQAAQNGVFEKIKRAAQEGTSSVIIQNLKYIDNDFIEKLKENGFTVTENIINYYITISWE